VRDQRPEPRRGRQRNLLRRAPPVAEIVGRERQIDALAPEMAVDLEPKFGTGLAVRRPRRARMPVEQHAKLGRPTATMIEIEAQGADSASAEARAARAETRKQQGRTGVVGRSGRGAVKSKGGRDLCGCRDRPCPRMYKQGACQRKNGQLAWRVA